MADSKVPCGVCSSDRQWQCAGGELGAGDAAGRIAEVEEAAGGMDLAEAERGSTHWGLAGGRAAGAGTEDVGPCRAGALGAVEVGAWCSSALASSVSELSPSRGRDDVRSVYRGWCARVACEGGPGKRERVCVCVRVRVRGWVGMRERVCVCERERGGEGGRVRGKEGGREGGRKEGREGETGK